MSVPVRLSWLHTRGARVAQCLLLAASLSSALAAQTAASADSARVAGWRSDLLLLEREAKRVHAGPTRPAHTPAFAAAVADLAARVPTLPDRRIVVEIQRLMARLGDGHSLVYPAPAARASFAMLPIDVYLFADGLYIVAGRDSAASLVGQRITRIGGLEPSAVIRRLEPYVSRDNAVGVQAFASLYLLLPPFLEAVGAAPDSARVVLELADAAGVRRTVTLRATAPRRSLRTLPRPPGSGPVPLWLQHPDRNLWMSPLAHDGLYVQFNQVADGPTTSLAAFSTQLRERLADGSVRYLVVDVRHNTGGNNRLLDPLLATLGAWADEVQSRSLYVLTSRSTFSAAQNFINRLERRVPRTVFAGEPSMSSPNFTGEDFPVPLPFSGLTVSISNRYWQDSDPSDRRPFIAPQLDLRLRGTDWLAGRDPVLERVLESVLERVLERVPQAERAATPRRQRPDVRSARPPG